jgi:hypothetical protein
MGIPVPLFWLRTFYVEFRWSPDEVHLESRYIEYKYANSSIFQVDSRWTPDGYWSPAGVHLNSVGECKVCKYHVVHLIKHIQVYFLPTTAVEMN